MGIRMIWFVVAAVACGSQSHGTEKSGEGGRDRVESEAAPIIEIEPMQISQDGHPMARLFADGRTQGRAPDETGQPNRWVPGPTLHADGTITMTKGGVTARVEADGEIWIVAPPGTIPREKLFGRISGDQLAFAGSDNDWSVRIDGDMIRFNGPGAPNQIDGAVDAQSRKTALIMTAAFFIDMAITPR